MVTLSGLILKTMQLFYHNRHYKATRATIAVYSTTNKSDEPMRNQLVIKQTMQPRRPNNPELIFTHTIVLWSELINLGIRLVDAFAYLGLRDQVFNFQIKNFAPKPTANLNC